MRSVPAECRELEGIPPEQLLLMLVFLLLPLLLHLLLSDLVFLEFMQHVTERAVHLGDGPIEASDDAPRAQRGHLALLRPKQSLSLCWLRLYILTFWHLATLGRWLLT